MKAGNKYTDLRKIKIKDISGINYYSRFIKEEIND
jgi:hypothetical protein